MKKLHIILIIVLLLTLANSVMIFVMFRRFVSNRNQGNVSEEMRQYSSKEFKFPMPIDKEPIVYPEEAKKLGIEGIVLVKMLINEEGIPESSWVKKSSGSSILDNAAVEYTKKVKFTPATEKGKPVSTSVIFPIKFIIKDTEK